MEAWSSSLFYIIFVGQIIVISIYLPEKIVGRMRYVLDTYPPSEYPKLYPRSAEYHKIGISAFRLFNRIICGLGVLLLFLLITVVDHSTFADDGYISEAWPAAYGMIQFLPFLALELSGFSQLKLMRQVNQTTSRRAELRRRRFFDFVSKKLFVVAVVLYLAALVANLYADEFEFTWGLPVWLTVGNLFMVAVAAWQLYGRKPNPHQTFQDRAKEVGAMLNSFVYVSIALSLYYIVLAADQKYDLDYLDAIMLSIYFQGIAILSIGTILRIVKLKDIDFDVYKDIDDLTVRS